ncbi:hypothetical protein [Thiobacillus sp.]
MRARAVGASLKMQGSSETNCFKPGKESLVTWEALINSKVVIASEAKQSRISAKSMASGSPRHFVPRDDGINQRLPSNLYLVYPHLT